MDDQNETVPLVTGGAPAPTPAPASSTAQAGVTEVEREVVEKIAAAAARSVPGVADLGGDVARFFDSVLDRVGLDEVGDATRGVRASVNGTETRVTVVLVIQADGVVPDITTAVRAAVTEDLEKYGLRVTAVDIKVDDITMA
ncbi:Asp23/Gls24 family envelope stress response protein [Kineosporia sp. J2-2]|uniref:Asp23/Gls24 family envelope stress response protein n=1 Tax=Kineosporia corallincola TaxID=2835133 RepID=A0ABS5TBM3_9ACTN|nr:Asp23/Gls24 family envelope stress response protein [Kineosporia corallincola]MBT0767606.1 Asp23/Gls24 family envelope stress response protein [Kineosporia corallincola]